MTETREVYLTNDPALNRILQAIADRLDILEGLKTDGGTYGTLTSGVLSIYGEDELIHKIS